MLNDFIKETEREFDELLSHFKNVGESTNYAVNVMRRRPNSELERELKSFTSSKLREFAGEFGKKVEEMKKPVFQDRQVSSIGDAKIVGRARTFNAALDSVLNLLDGVGKE